MAGCGPCPDSCNCQIVNELGNPYPGSGDAGSPIVIPQAVPQATFAAGSLGGTIAITPGGTAGHSPNFEVAVCGILDEATTREFGRIMIFSNDADCKPERLRDPLENEYLGFDPVSEEAAWLPLPSGFSLEIDPNNELDVTFGASGLLITLPVSETVIFTVSGNFDKADYPNMRALRGKGVAGGGGSGGTQATAAGQNASSGGGGGGEYFEFEIPVSALAASEPVTIGAGGAGGAAGLNNGGTGGTTSFGAHASAIGGQGGLAGSATATNAAADGGDGGTGGTVGPGGINIQGGPGGAGFVIGGVRLRNHSGGASQLGNGAQIAQTTAAQAGQNYGSGAGGASQLASSAALAGAAGAPGIILLEVLY